jgi:hypothetical protein
MGMTERMKTLSRRPAVGVERAMAAEPRIMQLGPGSGDRATSVNPVPRFPHLIPRPLHAGYRRWGGREQYNSRRGRR